MSKKNKNKTNNITIKPGAAKNILSKNIIFYILFLLISLLPQYFKGGYFAEIYLPFCFIMGISLLYHFYYEYKASKNTIIQSSEDIFMLLLTIIYGLSFFYGINKRGSIIEFIKYVSFISVFLISRNLHRDKKKRSVTVDIIIFSGVILSIISVGTMIGSWKYPGSYVGGRLFSVFQYPNTFASYVVFIYFLTMGKILIEEKPIKIGIYGIALNIFFSSLIFTYSRGMWLIFPVVLLLYFILLSRRKKVQLFFYTLVGLLISLPFSFLFLGFVGKEASLLWYIYIGGTIISGLVLYILGKSKRIFEKISVKALVATIVALGIVIAIVLGVFINSAMTGESSFIPQSIINRLTGISSSDSSFQARIIFSMDALRLAKKSPVLGSGGSGWMTAYRSVQSYPYSSTEVHNHFLQILVEVGVLGLLLFLGIFISIGYKYLKFKRSDSDDEKTMADTLMIACFTILAHAFIDFDFSITGYYIIFWILLGMISSMVSENTGEIQIFSLKLDKKFLKKISILIPILSLVGIILSGTLYAGIQYYEKSLDAEYDYDDMDLAEKHMKKASSLDPYNTEYREDLVRIYIEQYSNKDDTSYGFLAKEEVDKTIKIAKDDPIVYIKATEAYFKFGMIDEGIAFINKSLELQPLVIDVYLLNTNIYTATLKHYLNQGELDNAQVLAQEGHELMYNSLMAANQRTIRPMDKNNQFFFELNELKYYSENMDEFLWYYDRDLRLKYAYDLNLDVDGDGEIELVSFKNDNDEDLYYEIKSKDQGIRLENQGKEDGVFDSVDVNLLPNTTYIVKFDAKGDMDMGKSIFYIMDTEAEVQIQTDSINLELSPEYQTYEYGFSTDGDIGENSSIFRFVIAGENKGYMDLKGIRIFESMY